VVPFQSVNHQSAGPPVPPLHAEASKEVFFGSLSAENLWLVMFLVYFFTLQSSYSKTCGARHRITNCSRCSHVFQCGSHSVSSGRRELCVHAFELGTVAWYMHLLQGVPTLLLWSVVCCLQFCASIMTKAKHFHCQGMLHGIHGGGSHGFVHGIKVTMSTELTLLILSWVIFICSVVSGISPLIRYLYNLTPIRVATWSKAWMVVGIYSVFMCG
jgi:hypothetical protein